MFSSSVFSLLVFVCVFAIANNNNNNKYFCLAQNQAGPEYLLGAASSNPSAVIAPPGYVIADLATVKSSDFLSYYNNQGLQDNGETFTSNSHCLIVAVAEGALAIGSQISPSFFGPFGTNQLVENTSQQLTTPIFFGTLSYGGKGQNTYIGPLGAQTVLELFAVPISDQRFSSFCDPTNGFYGLYTRAVYTISGNGQNFPSPSPSSRMQLVTVADLQSASFIAQYNAQGLSVDASAFSSSGISVDDQSAMCCIFFTADGYLEMETYPLGPYVQNSDNSQCVQQKSLTAPVFFGLFPSGAYVGQLNSSAVKQLAASYNDVPGGACSNAQNTLAIYKMPKPLAPPSPPDLGDCIEVELQGAYFDESQNLNCLSDRFRYVLKFNTTYDTIQMDSFDTCGFSVAMSGVEIIEYPSNSSVFVARIQSLSSCAGCSGWGWLPLSGVSEMTTMCHVTIGEFGWCMGSVSSYQRMKCPPFPPSQNYLKVPKNKI